jgi:8-oxo-dGTP diphosphatase
MTEVANARTMHASIEVQVKLALLTIVGGMLKVAIESNDPCRLPGHQPAREDSLDGLARATLRALVGLDSGYMEQLYTFSFGRNVGSEIVVSYLGLVPGAPELSAMTHWEPTFVARECLRGSDQTVLDYALVRLRAKIGYTTIAFHLMAESFALSDLQHTYETILDRPLDPRNFRRRIISSGLVQAENRKRRAGSHRPAALYRFAGNHDPASYLTPDSPGPGLNEESEMPRDTQ